MIYKLFSKISFVLLLSFIINCAIVPAVFAEENETDANGIAVNLVNNPGFETGDYTSWEFGNLPVQSPIPSNEQPHSGNYSALVQSVANQEQGHFIQRIDLKPGKKYKASIWTYLTEGNEDGKVIYTIFNGADVPDENNVVDIMDIAIEKKDGWENNEWIFVVPNSALYPKLQIYVTGPGAEASMKFDDIEVTETQEEIRKDKEQTQTPVDEEQKDNGVIDEKKVVDARDLIVKLGITKGLRNSKPSSSSTVTRAEMSMLITRMLGLTDNLNVSNSESLFTDVDNSHWAAGAIKMACDMGVIQGFSDGTFKPDDVVSYEQAIKMLVCVLGYKEYAQSKGDYPTGYLLVAAEQKLTKNVTPQSGKPITWGNLWIILKNCLDVEILSIKSTGKTTLMNAEKGKTLLNTYLNINKIEGILNATKTTSILNQITPSNDEVIIGNEYYTNDSIDVSKLIGFYVVAYERHNSISDDKKLLYVYEKENKNSHILIDASDIDDYSSNILKYWNNKEEKQKEVNISYTPFVIYNKKTYIGLTKDLIMPQNGKIELISNDGDDVYDVVSITSYKTYIVSKISQKTNNISCKDTSIIEVDPSNDDYTFEIVKDGKAIGIDDLKEWDVVSYAESINTQGKKHKTLDVSQKKVSGIVDEISTSDSKVVIEKKEYKFLSTINKTLVVGDNGDFYLDADGEIAYFDIKAKGGYRYGYLSKAVNGDGVNSNGFIKVYEFDDKLVDYELDDKISINNGQPMTLSQVVATAGIFVNDGTGRISKAIEKLIYFSLGSNNKVNNIITPEGATDFLVKQKDVSNSKYKSGTSVFGDNEIFINKNTTVLIIYTSETADLNERYEIGKSWVFWNDGQFTITAYKTNDDPIADIIVYKKGTADSGDFKNSSPCMVVDHIVTSIDKDGTQREVLYYYEAGKIKKQISKVSLVKTDASGQKVSLAKGDVIQFSITSKSKMIDKFYLRFDITARKISTTGSGIDSEYRMIYGTVSDYKYGYVTLATGFLQPVPSSIIVYQYNTADNSIEIADTTVIEKGAGIFIRTNNGVAKEIMIVK